MTGRARQPGRPSRAAAAIGTIVALLAAGCGSSGQASDKLRSQDSLEVDASNPQAVRDDPNYGKGYNLIASIADDGEVGDVTSPVEWWKVIRHYCDRFGAVAGPDGLGDPTMLCFRGANDALPPTLRIFPRLLAPYSPEGTLGAKIARRLMKTHPRAGVTGAANWVLSACAKATNNSADLEKCLSDSSAILPVRLGGEATS